MATKKKYTAIRLYFANDEDLQAFRDFETILCVQGMELPVFLKNYVKSNANVLKGRNIVDTVTLIAEHKTRFPSQSELSRQRLRHLRNEVWDLGYDYYAAPSSERTSYRYDLERCLKYFESEER